MIVGTLALTGFFDLTDDEIFFAIVGLAAFEAAAEALVIASLQGLTA